MLVPDGASWTKYNTEHYNIGSFLVKAGCTFYVYSGSDYDTWGTYPYDIFPGPHLEPYYKPDWVIDGHKGPDGCSPGPYSLQCRCDQKPIDCTPDDEFQVKKTKKSYPKSNV